MAAIVVATHAPFPKAVSATGSTYLQSERGIEDVVFATLHYPDARMAHIHVSWLDPHRTRKLTVVGDRKMAVFDDTSADQKLAVFDKAVRTRKAPLADGVSGLQVVRALEGGSASLAQGGARIELPGGR